MKRNRKNLFCNCPCAFNSPLFINIMIFYLNLFKAIKFAPKVIDMNRPAPNLQLGLGSEICRKLYRQFAISRNCKKSKQNIAKDEYLNLLFDFLALFVPGEESIVGYNFLRHNSFPSPIVSWTLAAGLFISITLRANLKALNTLEIIRNHYIPE